MGIFQKIKQTGLAVKENTKREVVVSVPDIKEYLVREYNRVNDLKLQNEGLQQQLEQAEELKLKYDAALVTLDEYSKRLKQYESKMTLKNDEVIKARNDVRIARDEVNSYKIRFTNAAITKEEIIEEIIEELKSQIILNINNHKGSLSKKIACEIVEKSTL